MLSAAPSQRRTSHTETDHLLSLMRSNSEELLKKRVSELRGDELRVCLDVVCRTLNTKLLSFAQHLLDACGVDPDSNVQQRYETMKFLLNLPDQTLFGADSTTNTENANQICEMPALLIEQIDYLPASQVFNLAEIFLLRFECVGEACSHAPSDKLRWFTFLSKLVNKMGSFKTIQSETTGECLSGSDARTRLIRKLCAREFNSNVGVNLITAFKDTVTLSNEELNMIVRRIVHSFGDLESVKNVPTLVYNLLAFVKTSGASPTIIQSVLGGISNFFTDARQDNDDFFEAESSTAVYVSQALHDDRATSRAFIKLIKAKAEGLFSRFNVSVLLLVANRAFHKELMFDLIKAGLFDFYKAREHRHRCAWIRQVDTEEIDAETVLLDIASKSAHREEALRNFGFYLMDLYLPRVQVVGGKLVFEPHNPMFASTRLGARILLTVFHDKKSDESKTLIYTRLLSSLAEKPSSGLYLIELLSKMADSFPLVVKECSAELMKLFEELPSLPPDWCAPLLRSVLPIVKLEPRVRDHLISVLRKAAFNVRQEARLVSVNGFIELLKHVRFVRNFSSSQAASQSLSFPAFSSQAISASSGNSQTRYEQVCLEVIGCLRRALCQQADIRRVLYDGLASVVRRNKTMLGSVVDVLHDQFLQYYEVDGDVQPPFRLQACAAEVGPKVEPVLLEPLSGLIAALSRCLDVAGKSHKPSELDAVNGADESQSVIADDGETRDVVLKRTFTTLSNFLARMTRAEPEDFGISKDSDFSADSMTGRRNAILLREMLAIFDALIEFAWSQLRDFARVDCERVLLLYEAREMFDQLIAEKAIGAKKMPGGREDSGVRGQGPNTPRMSFYCLRAMLLHVLRNQRPMQSEGLRVLRQCEKFLGFVFTTVLKKVQALVRQPVDRELKHFNELFLIANLMILYYAAPRVGVTSVIAADVNRVQHQGLKLCALEIVAEIFELVARWLPDRVGQLYAAVARQTGASTGEKASDVFDTAETFFKCLLTFFESVDHAHTDDDDDDDSTSRKKREGALLIRVLTSLTAQFPVGDPRVHVFYMKFHEAARQKKIADTGLNKAMQLLFELRRKCAETCELERTVARCVRVCLAGEALPLEDDGFDSITKRGVVTVFGQLVAFAQEQLDDVAWVVARVHAGVGEAMGVCSASNERKLEKVRAVRRAKEVAVCGQLEGVIALLGELVATSVPALYGTALIKVLTKLYATLAEFAKFYYDLFMADANADLCANFEGLVRHSGREFLKKVYECYQSIQAQQQEVNDKSKVVGSSLKARTLREMNLNSALVFAIEKTSGALAKLAKKCGKSLDAHYSVHRNRDFRIDADQLTNALRRNDEDEDVNNDGASEAPSTPPSRRLQVRVKQSASACRQGAAAVGAATKKRAPSKKQNEAKAKKVKNVMNE